MTSVDAVTSWCDVQCRWMLVSMWTWLWIVRRTNPVRMFTHLATILPTRQSTPTTAIITRTYTMDPAQSALHIRNHGGRSTWEWHCTSTESNSPTRPAMVRTLSLQCGLIINMLWYDVWQFGTEFDRMTADTLQTFKVKRSEVNITAWCISSKTT